MATTYDFAGASGNLPAPWSRFSGTLIQRDGSGNGQNAAANDHEVVYSGAVSSLAQYVQIKYSVLSGGNDYIWVIVRASGTDATRNNIQVSGGDFDNNIYFTRVTNGSGVDFASDNRGVTLALNDVLRCEIDSNGTNPSVIAKVNGTTVGTHTYTGTLNQVGDAGFGLYGPGGGGTSGPKVDDWEAGDIGGAAAPYIPRPHEHRHIFTRF